MDMKVTHLGINWGAAYQEAQPIEVKAMGRRFEAFISEGYDLILELPLDAIIRVDETAKKIVVKLENGL